MDAKALLAKHVASGREYVVHFTATWCGPCKRVEPRILAHVAETGVPYVCFDIDEFDDVAAEWSIGTVPTFVRCRGGQRLSEFAGADEHKFRAMCELALASPAAVPAENVDLAEVPRAI